MDNTPTRPTAAAARLASRTVLVCAAVAGAVLVGSALYEARTRRTAPRRSVERRSGQDAPRQRRPDLTPTTFPPTPGHRDGDRGPAGPRTHSRPGRENAGPLDDTAPRPTTAAARLPSRTVLIGAAVAGAVLVGSALYEESPPQPSPAQQNVSAARLVPERPQQPAAVRPLAPADPVRLLIPAIGVNAPMTRLELNEEGALRPPPATAPALAGWYGDGATPGENGTAVTAGHVDTPAGRGVFYRLGALGKGDTINVVRKDRRTAVFTVDGVEVHDKDDFPDERVYGDSGRPELRVITCGGDRSAKGGYEGNVVVYATLTAVK